MIYLFMLIKTAAWAFAFWFGITRGAKGMLLWATGISFFLTIADKMTIAGNVALPGIMLTLFLYALMSFFLFPLAWKLKNPAVSAACSVMGTFGAFAVVNFTMNFLRTALEI